jgi:hypothetical protein
MITPAVCSALPKGSSSATITKYTGNRAEQLISGATRIVTSRSFRFSIVRVAITPGPHGTSAGP